MNTEIIGINAGIVWSALNEKEGTQAFKDLRKATKLKEKEAYAALGWLAREGKITICEVEGDIEIGLI